MIIYPAIDIKAGRCVRLYQGQMDKVTLFPEYPTEAAKRWEAAGAKFIHVVDLDGAGSGEPKNILTLEQIIKSVNIPIQFGGGIRGMYTVKQLFNLGVSRIILGTALVNNPDLLAEACAVYQGKIAVGLDVKDECLAIHGWEEKTDINVVDVINELEKVGVSRIIYTDISVDGTMQGPNIKGIRSIAKKTNIPLIASGGVSSIKDIKAIKKLESLGVEGIIIGKALYSEAFTLEEAIKVAEKNVG
ncbi:1-(5-phosphoribosyl)-5-[(5-phosphoribosylamino)methylideneamino]imidazole-4-carboxamide isomerase [Candidatus Oleimmundimicrobium sp.]|uniref:1-(5-phosphoribosyl)-5-[(5- phosphoribosylamino)methylideneamino]imidazole-4- carboxamide isomerase n=1 Tax=Candidatus Oleimmundimicrobium sp. TaxID=3060597 RepID=UPI002722D87D|nr:1-(5-phosphoribosyl)-5-[(5-phosphoribosylamino)methylideneamino]imidazole-4-carboxamide isomerase [Candidatus Oleimmundimicrobium sp.]MDO8886637.1 1-(5-phosphoribosyl)-5-[(5-phosphoribosylamino)methylideneamino]imidazole-4-carboxamide isomerase [Candidatus Oleimmundimicrobium sp.]